MRVIGVFAVVVLGCSSLVAQSVPERNEQFLTSVREQIKGRETQAAGEVFKNVQFLKNVPAATFLTIMDIGYSAALGVTCTHCHVERDFASDDKRAKRAAREMQVMHRSFNEQLRGMVNSEKPPEKRTINCATCHRGKIDPNSGEVQ
jgi:hypothetical protein